MLHFVVIWYWKAIKAARLYVTLKIKVTFLFHLVSVFYYQYHKKKQTAVSNVGLLLRKLPISVYFVPGTACRAGYKKS